MAFEMESDLLSFVRESLRAVGPKVWPVIERDTGKSINTLRKLAYNDRRNPRLETVEPIANWFRERQ